MIAYITGVVHSHTKDGAIILCGSIGYEVIGTWLGRCTVGNPVEAWIYEYLENESIPRMVACQTADGRNLFLQLLSVQGVGPKMGSRIIDSLPTQKLITAITTGDVDVLTSVKGLGKKTAQKIVLELGKILVSDVSNAHSNIYEALTALRFTPKEIQSAIDASDLDGLSESAAIRAVLQTLGGSR